MQLEVDSTIRFGITSFAKSTYAREAIYNLSEFAELRPCESLKALELHLLDQSIVSLPDVLLLEIDECEECFDVIEKFKRNIVLKGIITVLLSDHHNPQWVNRAKQLGVHDYYEAPYAASDILERLAFLVKFKLIKPTLSGILEKDVPHFEIPLLKRAFDIGFALMMLIILSPIMLFAALCVRLESKGPIIYKSRRVGTGFKIFNFYKFRSMYADAERRLAELAALNEYKNEDGSTTFYKIKNDPRITKVGHFIRRTSIDELPQLINILMGDMSVVGNRPLPFYEAERLTCDEWTWRFLAPSGLTGLWQIRRRGKANMSERERKKLDNFYARKYSMFFDLKILFMTPFVFLQKTDD
jgi:lipopolysaccharide/colanic/teichoic acid biosynthesis glycosyltransferase